MRLVLSYSNQADFTGLLNYISTHDFFWVIPHETPDGDAIGSALALVSFLRRIGKKAVPCSKGPFSKSESISFSRKFESELVAPAEYSHEQLATILVDCSSFLRTGFTELISDRFMIIDHHAIVEADAGEGYVDTEAPANALLIARLINAYGEQLSKKEAYYLALGFCTDTGFFRHLRPQKNHYLHEAFAIIENGEVSLNEVYEDMQGVFSLESRRYMGELLAKTQSYYEGKVLVVVEEYEHLRKKPLGVTRDTDKLYQLLFRVERVEVVILLRDDDRGISCGLRSKDKIDVATIASTFGGGGHKLAAGFLSQEPLNIVKDKLLQMLKQQIYQ